MTAIGTRRPREGRCERCDRPLTDEVYETRTLGAFLDLPESTVTDWYDDDAQPGHCMGEHLCAGPSIDWRARALAAEAALKDAEGREALAVSMWREVEDAARSAVRGDAEPPRNVSTDPGLDLFLTVKKSLADAEARGRQHGLLAALWTLGESREYSIRFPARPTADEAQAFTVGVINTTVQTICDAMLALAKEATDGR